MAVLTGASGGLLFKGASAGCVRSWSLNLTKDALETTCLGERDRQYVPGLRGATGTADILYDPTGPAGSVFNTILDDIDEAVNDVVFVICLSNIQCVLKTVVNRDIELGGPGIACQGKNQYHRNK